MSYLISYAFVLHSQTGTRRGRSRVTRSLSYAPEVVYMSARTPCGPAELEAAHNPVLVERMLVSNVIHCITLLNT